MTTPHQDRTAPATLLVLGGARSGKSTFAERQALVSGLPRIYIATATASDDEMQDRIAHHRARRDEGWRTIEEPLDLIETLSRQCSPDVAVVVDCLTLWLANLMAAERDPVRETARLADWLRTSPGQVIIVSNEIGLGLVPLTPLGRSFRDAQGRLNQEVAAAASAVVFLAAGLPLWLKRAAQS